MAVLGTRPGDQHADAGSRAAIEKPARRRVIDAHEIDPDLAHQRKIDIHLFGATEIIPFAVRFKRTVGDALAEKFLVAFEKEFRARANPRFSRFCHVERRRMPRRSFMRRLGDISHCYRGKLTASPTESAELRESPGPSARCLPECARSR